EVRPHDPGEIELGAREIGAREVRPVELRAKEVRPGEVRPFEVEIAQIEIVEGFPGKIRRLLSCCRRQPLPHLLSAEIGGSARRRCKHQEQADPFGGSVHTLQAGHNCNLCLSSPDPASAGDLQGNSPKVEMGLRPPKTYNAKEAILRSSSIA